jgi:hypothetical protein
MCGLVSEDFYREMPILVPFVRFFISCAEVTDFTLPQPGNIAYREAEYSVLFICPMSLNLIPCIGRISEKIKA